VADNDYIQTGLLMGQHYLSSLFSPQSVAVIGASNRPQSVGGIVFANLLTGGYQGKLYAVNPKHKEIQGQPAFASIDQIGERVDLVVIATPAATVPDIIEACGKHGVRAAVILSAGFGEAGADGTALQQTLLEAARRYGIRLIGPNCLGLMRPSLGLNATFSNGGALPGKLALVSQSGALCTAILDWAHANEIGFSSVVSLGDSADVDFGETLDFLVSDRLTEAVLLYIEGIRNARNFMSALRAAARIKPVIVVKVGRHEAGKKAALSHTDAMVVADDVFDATLRRAGAVRVMTIAQLFTAAQALSSGFRPRGNRLAIVTNGGGPAVMAADRAADLGIELATLSTETVVALNAVLPPTWSKRNPLDIIGDADAARYRQALSVCMQDANVDGALVILTPQAMTKPLDVAETVIEIAHQSGKPLLACWMGDGQVTEARAAFTRAHIPNFRTPEPAVEVFSFISAYVKNQQLLLQTPGPLSHHTQPDVEGARLLIENVLAERRHILSEMESKALLAAFHIPVTKTVVAHSPNEALLLAEQFGFPVAMKVSSPDLTHKSDAGGVRLNLSNAQAVRTTYQEIMADVQRNRPNAHIDGIAIEPMIMKPNGRELMIGVTTDPVFGPVITLGMGGVAVEILGDRAVELPPLNRYLASNLISRTRVAKLLGQFRHMPPADMEALLNVLISVSEMTCELPWLKEMDINPLLLDEKGAIVVDARVVVDFHSATAERYAHMAIHPYPSHLESRWQLPDATDVVIRPIRPEDAQMEQSFVRGLSCDTKYSRFMGALEELTPAMLVCFTQIDYDREMALMAVTEINGKEVELGIARYVTNPDAESCEFALVVSDQWQHKGIGHKLMTSLMDVARSKGLKRMEGEVLTTNQNMLLLVRSLGFSVAPSLDDPSVECVIKVL
jgi:acetyltransferase